MAVHVNRGVALETATVVDFSSLVSEAEAEAEAETVRLSSSLHPSQVYQDRP